ncbi:hypothetical protein KCQ_18357 [Pectobacterium atrosepticum ICMP 1526]|nr:hypothetical protein KCQ_18357 [Pectobacterium atrosepticum ICMP 1526]
MQRGTQFAQQCAQLRTMLRIFPYLFSAVLRIFLLAMV